MKQSGDNANTVQIGDAGSRNNFNIVQNQNSFQHTQLLVNGATIKEFDAKVLSKDHNRAIVHLLGPMLLGALGFLSDSIGISEHFGFPLWWLFPLGIVAGLLMAKPYFRSSEIWSKSVQSEDGEAVFLGDNEIVERGEDGKVFTYQRVAKCIYPNCNGSIQVTTAPEREMPRLGKKYIGTCSLAGRDHSYRIDYIWNAYPEQFDWRPIEPVSPDKR